MMPGDHTRERALARPRGADQRRRGALVDPQVHIADAATGGRIVEGQVPHLDAGGCPWCRIRLLLLLPGRGGREVDDPDESREPDGRTLDVVEPEDQLPDRAEQAVEQQRGRGDGSHRDRACGLQEEPGAEDRSQPDELAAVDPPEQPVRHPHALDLHVDRCFGALTDPLERGLLLVERG